MMAQEVSNHIVRDTNVTLFVLQVLAREMMAQEVSNQSDSNLMIAQKILVFLRRLEDVERMVKRVENRMLELSARLYSDGETRLFLLHRLLFSVCLSVCLSLSISVFRGFSPGTPVCSPSIRYLQNKNIHSKFCNS